jgi:hypothetical protein
LHPPDQAGKGVLGARRAGITAHKVVPRPSSLAELAAAKEIAEFWDEGTHTILDIDRVYAAGDDPDGAIFPLTPAELNRVFGTQQPSAAHFDRVYQPGPGGPLGGLTGGRWSGRSMVIYKGRHPCRSLFLGILRRLVPRQTTFAP